MKAIERLSLVLILVAIACYFTACGNKLIGTWEYEEKGQKIQMTFEKDGKGSMKMSSVSFDMEWETDDDELTVTMTMSFMGQSSTKEETFTYDIDGDTLTLKNKENGEKIELTRVDD